MALENSRLRQTVVALNSGALGALNARAIGIHRSLGRKLRNLCEPSIIIDDTDRSV